MQVCDAVTPAELLTVPLPLAPFPWEVVWQWTWTPSGERCKRRIGLQGERQSRDETARGPVNNAQATRGFGFPRRDRPVVRDAHTPDPRGAKGQEVKAFSAKVTATGTPQVNRHVRNHFLACILVLHSDRPDRRLNCEWHCYTNHSLTMVFVIKL